MELEHDFAENRLRSRYRRGIELQRTYVGENQQGECSNGVDSTKLQYPRLSFIQVAVYHFHQASPRVQALGLVFAFIKTH